MVPTYLAFRRVARHARSSVGLLRSAFVIEGWRTCYSLSIWRHEDAIPIFGTAVQEHVAAARGVFGRLTFDSTNGPELWSTKWRLARVSNNLRWDGLDLRSAIALEDRRSYGN